MITVKEKTQKISQWYKSHLSGRLTVPIALSILVNLYIEAMARQGLGKGLLFVVEKPVVFLLNALIIFVLLSIGILVRKKILLYMFVSLTFIVLGTINGIILSKRMTPFTTKDAANLKDGITIITNYFSVKALIAGGILVFFLLIGILLLFLKGPKSPKINYRKKGALFLAIIFGTFGIMGLSIKAGILETYFGNLAYAYRDFGFTYCFVNTWLNTGISPGKGYSDNYFKNIFPKEEREDDGYMDFIAEDDGIKHPNIVMVQLESFSDPMWFKNITLSKDPIPYFRSLQEKYSSGILKVPSVGAGTANTEFEVLTGISVRSFGPGEYPYKSILLKTTVETVAYDLKGIGYNAHAIHNHRGAFYGRNLVYPNMGFDTFTSLEYMNNVVKTPRNWARDSVLTEYIMDAMKKTEKEDFVFTVSVEGHGAYPNIQVLQEPYVEVTDAPSEELKWQYEYYVNLLNSMDNFIKELTSALSQYNEKVILVLYGDHLPAIDFTEEDLLSGDMYETPYVIWSNYYLPKEEKTLYAYQLAAETLMKANIHKGTMIKYHQYHENEPLYLDNMELLAYDMLYGKRFLYDRESPFERTDMKMGINPIKVNEVVVIGGSYFIKGENFTPFSKISINGNILETIYLGPSVLGLLKEINPDDVARMKVSQVEKNKEVLSTTE